MDGDPLTRPHLARSPRSSPGGTLIRKGRLGVLGNRLSESFPRSQGRARLGPQSKFPREQLRRTMIENTTDVAARLGIRVNQLIVDEFERGSRLAQSPRELFSGL